MAIEDFAETMLSKLRDLSSAEMVIGKAIEAGDTTIIPVSRVSVGFGLAGKKGKSELSGSGGGASIDPVAFLVLQNGEVKLLPVKQNSSVIHKAMDMIPEVIDSFKKDQE